MNARTGQPVLYTLVALLALGWIAGFTLSIGGFPDNPEDGYYLQLTIVTTVIATPWLLATHLLWHRWWSRKGADLATLDPPAQLLAAAVATAPGHRREWGAAMLAELEQVRDPVERWAFAASCTRAAAFPPPRTRLPTEIVAALGVVAVALARFVTAQTMPALQVFAVAFAALLGGLAVVTTMRSRRAFRPPTAGILTTAAGLGAVAACVAAVGYFLTEFPIGALHLRPTAAVLLAVALAGAVGLVLSPPRALVSSRLARHIAVAIAGGLAATLLVLSELSVNDQGPLAAGIVGYVLFAPVPVLLVASLATAFAGRSFRTGAQTAVWAALLTTLAFFAIALFEAVRWYDAGTSLILAADDIPLVAVGENLRNFSWGLILFPVWWLPFGILGAAIGAHLRGTRASTRQR